MTEHGVYGAMRVDLPGRDVLVDLPLRSCHCALHNHACEEGTATSGRTSITRSSRSVIYRTFAAVAARRRTGLADRAGQRDRRSDVPGSVTELGPVPEAEAAGRFSLRRKCRTAYAPRATPATQVQTHQPVPLASSRSRKATAATRAAHQAAVPSQITGSSRTCNGGGLGRTGGEDTLATVPRTLYPCLTLTLR